VAAEVEIVQQSGVPLEQLADWARARILESAARFLYEEGAEALAASQDVVPVDTGTLRASATEVGVNIEEGGDEVSVLIGYGGAAREYALIIHEVPTEEFSEETQQRRAAMGTGHKYLERPVFERAEGLEARAAAYIRADLERR